MMLVIVLVAGDVTLGRGVLAANPGACIINRTAIVGLEVLAGILDVQIPVVVTDVHLRTFVNQVPADIVKIGFGFGGLNRQTKVTTTQPPTLLAITIILRHKYTSKS